MGAKESKQFPLSFEDAVKKGEYLLHLSFRVVINEAKIQYFSLT